MPTYQNQTFNSQAGFLVPCLDVENGRAFRASGIPSLQDPFDAVEIAKHYSSNGGALLYLDIFDPYENEKVFMPLVEEIANAIDIPMTVMVQSGIIRDVSDVGAFLSAGASSYAINTSAIKNPNVINEATARYGEGCILGVMNVKLIGANRWEPYIHNGAEGTGLDAVEWAQEMADRGAGQILVNSMQTENKGIGYELELIQAIAEAVPVPVIASGGAGNFQHLHEVLSSTDAAAALVNSMFHTGRCSIAEAKAFLAAKL